jgi:broad specificity phosphatase PhoE
VKINELQAWLQERMPPNLLSAPPEVAVYDDEVVIVLPLMTVELDDALAGEARRMAERHLIARQREETRPWRMKLARELQSKLGRSVAWGMRTGESEALFSTRSVPVMTRLGRAERDVLDTLVAAGVADTRSAALAYAVRAFAAEHADWLDEVKQAIAQVEQVRARLKLSRRAGAPAVTAETEDSEG